MLNKSYGINLLLTLLLWINSIKAYYFYRKQRFNITDDKESTNSVQKVRLIYVSVYVTIINIGILNIFDNVLVNYTLLISIFPRVPITFNTLFCRNCWCKISESGIRARYYCISLICNSKKFYLNH